MPVLVLEKEITLNHRHSTSRTQFASSFKNKQVKSLFPNLRTSTQMSFLRLVVQSIKRKILAYSFLLLTLLRIHRLSLKSEPFKPEVKIFHLLLIYPTENIFRP